MEDGLVQFNWISKDKTGDLGQFIKQMVNEKRVYEKLKRSFTPYSEARLTRLSGVLTNRREEWLC